MRVALAVTTLSLVMLVTHCTSTSEPSSPRSLESDCANVGCAAPPPPGQACTARCGCCGGYTFEADAAGDAGIAASDAAGDASQATDGGPIDCSLVGCAAPPTCGVACSAPCGCCGCPTGVVCDVCDAGDG